MKKILLFITVLLILVAVFFVFFKKEIVEQPISAQAQVEEFFGQPSQFALFYLPQDVDGQPALARSEVWYYPELGKKITFVSGYLVNVEDYQLVTNQTDATVLKPGDFYFNQNLADLQNIFGQDNVDPVDYLPGMFESGAEEIYLTDQAVFMLESGKLTYLQTYGAGAAKPANLEDLQSRILPDLLYIQEAQARINLNKAFRCLGKACKFIVELPDKITRPLGPVFGPVASMILTNNIAKHKNLSKIFGRSKKISDIFKTVEEQKQLVSEVQAWYREAAEEMTKTAAEIRAGKEDLKKKLLTGDLTFDDFKANVADIEALAGSFEAGAEKFSKQSDKITLEHLVKMAGRDLVNKVFGQAREIVMDNVGRELIKLVNPDILQALLNQSENGADGLLDILMAGDLANILKNNGEGGIDIDELKKRIREEIKTMLRDNKEELKKNWKNKIAEIANRKLNELKAEVKSSTQQAGGQEESDETICDREPQTSADQCPSGYHYERMSGVGCVQTDCKEGKITAAHPSYTGQCVCGSAGSINEKPDDPNKACRLPAGCGYCPGCVYACVKTNIECPPIPKK